MPPHTPVRATLGHREVARGRVRRGSGSGSGSGRRRRRQRRALIRATRGRTAVPAPPKSVLPDRRRLWHPPPKTDAPAPRFSVSFVALVPHREPYVHVYKVLRLFPLMCTAVGSRYYLIDALTAGARLNSARPPRKPLKAVRDVRDVRSPGDFSRSTDFPEGFGVNSIHVRLFFPFFFQSFQRCFQTFTPYSQNEKNSIFAPFSSADRTMKISPNVRDARDCC